MDIVNGLYHWFHNVFILEIFGIQNLLMNYATECYSFTPSSLTLLLVNVANPLRLPVIDGAPSVIIPDIVFHEIFMSFTVVVTAENKSIPLVWLLRHWRSRTYSVTFMSLSTPLKQICN